VLFADIASAQPSSAGLLALKSSFAGVAVVTCLVDPRPRSGPAMPMAECSVQPSGWSVCPTARRSGRAATCMPWMPSPRARA